MSQERPQPSNPGERLLEEPPAIHPTFGFGGQSPLPPSLNGNTSTATPSRYWWLFNDLGLSPLETTMGQPTILAEAFLSLTHQVQVLARMMQTIIPLVPQLAQQSALPQPSPPQD